MTVQQAQLKVSLFGLLAGANANGGPFISGQFSMTQDFSDGVGANQFDRFYFAERTVNASTNDDIDLNGSAIADLLGVNIAAAEVVGILIFNGRKDGSVGSNVSNLTLGGASNPVPGFSAAGVVIKPGGVYLHMNPDATGIATVTAGTGDIFRVANGSGGSNTYTIGLLLRTS